MIEHLPVQINLVFILTTLFCFLLFFQASKFDPTTVVLCVAIAALQGLLAYKGFYIDISEKFYRLPLLVTPSLVLIILVFSTNQGRKFSSKLSLKSLTWLHIVRIPVELILHWLFLNKMIPSMMTFDGLNYDIFCGLYTPVIIMFAFRKRFGRRKWMIAWNCICLVSLLNIIIISAISLPPGDQFNSPGQPNRAVLYFPFIWLPACIVPVILYAHLAALYKLLRYKGEFVS